MRISELPRHQFVQRGGAKEFGIVMFQRLDHRVVERFVNHEMTETAGSKNPNPLAGSERSDRAPDRLTQSDAAGRGRLVSAGKYALRKTGTTGTGFSPIRKRCTNEIACPSNLPGAVLAIADRSKSSRCNEFNEMTRQRRVARIIDVAANLMITHPRPIQRVRPR